MLYIEEEGLSPRNLSPVLLDLAKGHKSDGDIEAPPTQSQVGTFFVCFWDIWMSSQYVLSLIMLVAQKEHKSDIEDH